MSVQDAFDRFRMKHVAHMPSFIRHDSDRDEMTAADGLTVLADGPGADPKAKQQLPPISPTTITHARVWAVRPDDVVHAPQHCPFGACRTAKEVKHSNLTAGQPAHSAGELIFVDASTIIVNGDSGRYGPRSAEAMHDVAVAFREAGYTTYSMGYDADANIPFRFRDLGAPGPALV